jgi:roadblock/LC7 domain-containing protein
MLLYCSLHTGVFSTDGLLLRYKEEPPQRALQAAAGEV